MSHTFIPLTCCVRAGAAINGLLFEVRPVIRHNVCRDDSVLDCVCDNAKGLRMVKKVQRMWTSVCGSILVVRFKVLQLGSLNGVQRVNCVDGEVPANIMHWFALESATRNVQVQPLETISDGRMRGSLRPVNVSHAIPCRATRMYKVAPRLDQLCNSSDVFRTRNK